LLNGAKVSGSVRSFDKYSIVLETKTQEQLIFKHSVSALLVCCKNKRCTETCENGRGAPKITD
jgi:sRNA-binding regulator protein Hfq